MHVYSAAELFLCSEASVSNSDSGTGTTTSTEEHVTATSEVPPPSLDSPASSAERIQQPSSSAVGKHCHDQIFTIICSCLEQCTISGTV